MFQRYASQVNFDSRCSSERYLRNVVSRPGLGGLPPNGLGGPTVPALANFARRAYILRRMQGTEMPTRNINLTPEQDAFVKKVVEAGEYQNASEAVRDALRVLQQRRQEDALKLKVLRAQIKSGIDELQRGEFVEIEDAALDDYLDTLATHPGANPR